MKRVLALILACSLLWVYGAFGEMNAQIGTDNRLIVAGQTQPVGENVQAIVAQTADAVYYTQQAADDASAESLTLWVYSNGEASKLGELGSNALYVENAGAIYFFQSGDLTHLMALDTATGQISEVSDLVLEGGAPTEPELALEGNTVTVYSQSDSSEKVAVGSWEPEAKLAETTAEPAVKAVTDLSKGSKGDEVLSLQKRLVELGYPVGTPDGVFGYKTYAAVRYFQDALAVDQTGVVTPELKKKILADSAPEYTEYVALDKGSSGIRVEALQLRLRALLYTVGAVDGSYGSGTAEAVRLFQRKAGLTQTGAASVETLKALMAKNAPVYSQYVALSKGDTGARVKKLQQRLYDLGYYAGKISGTYDDRTVTAVKLFQKAVDFKQDGSASASLQKKLFASKAPKCSEYISLQYGDTGARVKKLQTRLKELGYFSGSIGGHFSTKTRTAVKAFQKAIGVKQTGVATIKLQQKLFADTAPTATPKPTSTPTPTLSPSPSPSPSPTPTAAL